MKIGIGVITMGVRSIHPNIPGMCDPRALIRIQTDHQRQGVALTRNACLKFLYDQGCDYMFLFDDDCYPTFPGWEQYFIEVAREHEVHFLGLPHAFESTLLKHDRQLGSWDQLIGCFCFQTRRFMEVVGYYNTAYQRYGHEDQGRNLRATRSTLCGDGPGKIAPLRACAYIHSEDVYHQNPTPNLTHEEKQRFIELNRPAWEQEVGSKQLYYPPT